MVLSSLSCIAACCLLPMSTPMALGMVSARSELSPASCSAREISPPDNSLLSLHEFHLSVKLCMLAGDDSMTVHGRFHTVITVNQKNSTIVVGSNNIDPTQLGPGDSISAYTPDGKPVASATVTSISATSIPAGVSPNTVDIVFGGTYADDSFYLVHQGSQIPAGSWKSLCITEITMEINCTG